MNPPTRKLIGGVRESHTKEYLFQISAQTSGCRGRSKFRAQEQQEHETRARARVFGVKEREWKKRCQQGVPVGPKVDPLGQPQVLPDGILLGNFYSEFSGQLHCGEFFKVQKAAKTF